MTATKSRLPLNLIVVGVVATVAVAMWGVPDVSEIMQFGRPEDRDDGEREVCFHITSKPKAREMGASWRVGSKEGMFPRPKRVKQWETCEEAHIGDWASILAVPQELGTTKCWITVSWSTGSSTIKEGSSIHRGICRADGLVP